MKGGKEEEKRMDPIFPRLHINDAERGGPRAPPRNKMALSEQPAVSLPPQRLNPDLPSTSMLHFPPANSPTSIPGPSSSHVSPTLSCFHMMFSLFLVWFFFLMIQSVIVAL